ncbi:SDR family oxidoreductase [Rhodococcoides fascians A21d2]|uniref:SDR family NAD(P)-dependent oxidoreductase n=1 Tax=Rhodococcoides fascians TaxID=1828 RepID=UPI00056757D0|nr:SDR family NAD(P)-dependent oxidoreductase [Rhodococcus fascians]QII00323.1 SDR family oxidoreductase [Rhodococcus fascians A21d2]
MGRLTGKRVLITGTAGGQGAAAQELFAREGATVVGCDLHAGTAEASAALLRDRGYDVHGYDVDLSDPDSAREWIEAGTVRLGGIDVLYNNAAGFGFAPFSDMTIDLFRHVLKVELELVFNTISPTWKILTEAGAGSIINTASYSALRGIAPLGQVAHSAAKGAIISMTKSLAAEGASYGIRVNAISPGFVKSPATDAAVDEAGRNWQLNNHLIQRPGLGDDIAYMALFLASDESSWITGQNYSVDGGATAGWR